MTDEREILASEIRRLRKANRRLRIIAYIGFASAVAVMPFFTVAINQGIQFFKNREHDAEFRRSRREIDNLLKHLQSEYESLERAKKEYENRTK
jgi:uncharacterized protein YlxW (UPF0749 family)